MDTGFILNRRPFRDNSLLVDLLTKESGRITCIARVAKKRGKIMAGTLEPFRLLRVDWIGRGQVQTLTMAEEQGRYRVPVAELCKALYLNELVLKLIPKHAPAEEIFLSYQYAIKQITEQSSDLMDCEMILLESLGYSFRYQSDLQLDIATRRTTLEAPHEATYKNSHNPFYEPLQAQLKYHYSIDNGLSLDNESQAVPISGNLLIKLNGRSTLNPLEQQELRTFLNRLIDLLLSGKKLNSRKLAFGNY
ncbi:MAG: DNA repair protein RecO [Thiotrichaceae bacterium]